MINIGTKLEEDAKLIIYKRINELLNIDNPIDSHRFIGNHPVSLTKENIVNLLMKDYMVCEKSDGIRILCLLIDKKMYFYDRKNDVYEVAYGNINIDNSIVDGEVYLDDKDCLNYGIFDCLVYQNKSICEFNFLKRLHYCEQIVKRVKLTCNFYVKKMYKSYGFVEIYDQIKNLDHRNDGLIFTPVNDEYRLYKRGTHLKWKPPGQNTVDFKCIEVKPNLYSLNCFYKKRDMVFDYYETEENLKNKIVEFVYDGSKITKDIDNDIPIIGGWTLYKIRDDKDTPNHYRVVDNILSSLDNNLDIQELSRYYKPMRNNYKLREIEANKLCNKN